VANSGMPFLETTYVDGGTSWSSNMQFVGASR
jgi:hypothetical protein